MTPGGNNFDNFFLGINTINFGKITRKFQTLLLGDRATRKHAKDS